MPIGFFLRHPMPSAVQSTAHLVSTWWFLSTAACVCVRATGTCCMLPAPYSLQHGSSRYVHPPVCCQGLVVPTDRFDLYIATSEVGVVVQFFTVCMHARMSLHTWR